MHYTYWRSEMFDSVILLGSCPLTIQLNLIRSLLMLTEFYQVFHVPIDRCWDTKVMMTSSIKLFPHPCFVYAARYHPGSPHIIVTGGYDHLIRVWTKLSEGLNGKVMSWQPSRYTLFYIRILFFRPRLNILIFLSILGEKYSYEYS